MNEANDVLKEPRQPRKKVDEAWKQQIAREKARKEAEEHAQQEQRKQRQPERGAETGKRAGHGGTRFMEFVGGLAMQALMSMGEMPNPNTGMTVENLGEAKYLIDVIEMLQDKSKGNLTPEEAAAFEETLYSLRMTYVNKVQGPGKPPPQQQ